MLGRAIPYASSSLIARGSLFDYPLMFATLVTIALFGIAAYLVIVLAGRRLIGIR